MAYELRYTKTAVEQFKRTQRLDPAKHARVVNCLRKLGENSRHPGLNSHKYESKKGPNGEDLWESYVENKTPVAWRVFWCYGPDETRGDGQIIRILTVVAITPHP